MVTMKRSRINKAIALVASFVLAIGLMPLPALADVELQSSDALCADDEPALSRGGLDESSPYGADKVPDVDQANGTNSVGAQFIAPAAEGGGENAPEAQHASPSTDEPTLMTAQADSSQDDQDTPKMDKHNWSKHAGCYTFDQSYGQNTVLLKCEWSQDIPLVGKSQCEFWEWPLIIMNRPDDFYDGTPKEANWYVRLLSDGRQHPGFPEDIAEWDGEFTYTGIGGTKYGPTSEAPIAAGSYHVYTRIRVPAAADLTSDGSFTLAKTFTIRETAYDVVFESNAPDNASTKGQMTGAMQKEHFESRVESKALYPNQYHLPGYTFDGWNTKPDGSGTSYANNEIVKGLSYGQDVTLYAQWTPKAYTITYKPGDATSDDRTESATFDKPGILKAVASMGWSYPDYGFLGWAVARLGSLYDDEEDYVNLCGEPNSGGNLYDAVLTALWVQNGKIIVAVTKDGLPVSGQEGSFSLEAADGTVFTMPTTYQDGTYVFDPTQAVKPDSSTGQLPPGEYVLWFKAAPLLGAANYPESSVRIIYGSTYAVSTVFDYYTVTMEKDPAFEDNCDISMEVVSGANLVPVPNSFKATVRDGGELKIKTTAKPGYHFDGYSATGVAPLTKGKTEFDSSEAEQTIEVQGQVDIMAHVEANVYTVHFDPNAKGDVIGMMEDQDMVYDEPQSLFANQFVRANATFTGWNTKADGMGDAYEDKQSVENLTTENGGAITLYAQWQEIPAPATATLTFDLGGGMLEGQTGTITVKAKVGDEITMPAPTRDGYTFKYWKGSEYKAGNKYKVEADHAFTAVWEKNASGGGGSDTKGSPSKTGDTTSVLVLTLAAGALASLCLLALSHRRAHAYSGKHARR